MRLIKVKNQFFRFHDQDGDGNCLYRSIAASAVTNIKDHWDLCVNLITRILQTIEKNENQSHIVREIWNNNKHGDSLQHWCYTQQEDRKWSSSLDIEYLSYFHGINIISITNEARGHGSLETYRTLSTVISNGVLNTSDSVIYIYHHLYRRPFEIGCQANHWGWLEPVDREATMHANADIFDLDIAFLPDSGNSSNKRQKRSYIQSTISIIGNKLQSMTFKKGHLHGWKQRN